jgi:ribosomal protein S18 acetylase RimI-like enzyme
MSAPASQARLVVERVQSLSEGDLAALCEATDAAIIDGGGFGWIEPQGRERLARHFRGVLLVPERELFLARLDGAPAGSAQLVRPPRHNEAQAFAATLAHVHIAPYARGFGLARLLVRRVEERAAALGFRVLNLDVRATQEQAIALFTGLGYVRWGTHPWYARIRGEVVAGHFFAKQLEPARRRAPRDPSAAP